MPSQPGHYSDRLLAEGRGNFSGQSAGCAGNADILSASARVYDSAFRFRARLAVGALYPAKAPGNANKIGMIPDRPEKLPRPSPDIS